MARVRQGQIVLKGIEKVTDNLNKEYQKLKIKSAKGLIDSAIIVRRSMEDTSPKIPIDLGNLRASWFAVLTKGNTASPGKWKGKKAGKMKEEHSTTVSKYRTVVSGIKDPSMIMGFSANYAVKVHENIENYKFHRPGSGAKFFEYALNRNEKAILLALTKHTKIN